MGNNNLVGFFEKYLTREPLFKNKKVLQSSYVPEDILHRENEINQIANVIAPSLRLERPSNIFAYGKTGTGKTLSVKNVTDQMQQVANQKDIPLTIFYINCKLKKVADTEYRLMAHLCREMGKSIPPTGLPTDEIYKVFFDVIDSKEQVVILVLDELDQLVRKAGDEVLYNFTRMNSELSKGQISIIGISNDLLFADSLDPRIKSSLSEEEIVFPPYNAVQLQQILKKRAAGAFKEGSLDDGVIEKCSAYAARDHGDARRALELLRVAGELAERDGKTQITMDFIDKAEEKIEKDKVIDLVDAQPKQFQVVLYSVFSQYNPKDNSPLYTGDVYDNYKSTCTSTNLRPITQRRVSDILGELDMMGIINAKIISKGRHGRTREITPSLSPSSLTKVRKILEERLDL
ncbi:MAG: ORC1-type DNA replication protein [Nanobdellota archaeon]